jgi:23S rRNA (guanosine2251-2'-O)-methyltransferase
MSHRPFDRDGGEGFRPWKRGEGRDDRGFRGKFDRDGETDADGNFRNDNVWRSRDAQPRGGFGGHGGFDRRPPWKRDRDDGGFGGGRGGVGRRPPWKRDRDEEFGGRPSWRKDEDDTGRDFADAEAEDFEDDEPAIAEAATEAAETAEAAPAPEKPRAKKHEIPDGELIFGRQPVREMFRAGRRIVHKLILADGVKASEEITEIEALANERGVPVERHDRETLDGWLNSANHQGVLAVCADYPYAEFDEIVDAFLKKEGDALLVLLDHVVDPQNLGSLLRPCETAGVCGVVLPADRAVGVTPATVRASAGAAEHLAIARVSSLPDAILKLKEAKDESGEPVFVNVVGLEGADDSEPYTEIDYKGKTALVVGSEGLGLGKLVKERCDHLAKLPMFGKVSSLNAGVAGALVIYEALRQR